MPPPGQDVGRTFDAIDRNRDGVISPPEFHNYYGDTSPSPQPGLGSSAGGAAPLPPALADPARHLDPPTARCVIVGCARLPDPAFRSRSLENLLGQIQQSLIEFENPRGSGIIKATPLSLRGNPNPIRPLPAEPLTPPF